MTLLDRAKRHARLATVLGVLASTVLFTPSASAAPWTWLLQLFAPSIMPGGTPPW